MVDALRASGRAAHDPAGDLRGALTPKDVEHRAAIAEPKRVGELLRAVDGYVGQPSTHYALQLAPYVFVRPVSYVQRSGRSLISSALSGESR